MTTWESVDEENLYDSPPFRSWNILGERMDHFTDENYRPWMSARTIRNSLLPQWNDSDCSNVNFRQLIAPSLFLPLRPRMNVSPWSWAETGEVEIHLVIRLIGSCERFEWGVSWRILRFQMSIRCVGRAMLYGATRVDSRRALSTWIMGGKIKMRIVFDDYERGELWT